MEWGGENSPRSYHATTQGTEPSVSDALLTGTSTSDGEKTVYSLD